MKYFTKVVLICATLAFAATGLAGNAHAATLYGVGNASCVAWMKHSKSSRWHSASQWVLGFVSAASYYGVQGDFKDTENPAMLAWIDKYCAENPLSTVNYAAKALIFELAK